MTELKSGQITQSGDGIQTVFTFAHGCSATPDSVVVSPNSDDAIYNPSRLCFAIKTTWDATDVTVTYLDEVPASGTNNLIWSFVAVVN